MARIMEGHTNSSLSRNPRPRTSSSQDSTSQALEALTIPSSEGGVPSNPPQRRYEMWKPSSTPEVTSSRPESLVRHTSAKRLAGYSAPLGAPLRPTPPVPPQVEQAQQDELPTESVPPAPTTLMPKATYSAPPTTLVVPPDAPTTSEASITISATEFRAMIHTF
ncbi:gibberellin-regulated protein 14-like [Vitis riparia]|uniref:gibberellin-regulated protein 14-like n=1 Tax=Vitis riparia TaxID=96939 RepID=UPI00155AEF36|nr:gibberellin-regulated protein 14-like [Vitis riparia]